MRWLSVLLIGGLLTLASGDILNDNDIDIAFLQEERPILSPLLQNRAEADYAEPAETPMETQNYNVYASENYFTEAGRYYHVDPRLLWCIAKVESGLNPRAINKNTNGTFDIGIMQINTVHLPRLVKHGIRKEDLLNPKTNIYVGAWVLAGCLQKHGMTRNGITCYNGRIENNPYAEKVLKVFYQQENYAAR